MRKCRLSTGTVVAAVLLACPLFAPPHDALAQGTPSLANGIPANAEATLQARITAIDGNTRSVTLTGASGHAVTVVAGPLVRLDKLNVGDRVDVKYYRSVAFAVRPPQGGTGVPVTDDAIAQLVAQPVQAPGGVGVRLTKVSGTVVGLDLAANSVDLVNPSGGQVYTFEVTDPARIAMLGSLKVGDTVTAVVSQEIAVSIEPARRSWF